MPGAILTEKENAAAIQPLLLATITFANGAVRRLSSHNLTGAAQYGGNNYLPRVLNQEIAATQALAENGIDIPATVNLKLADPDYYLWTNDEISNGFKGSELVLTLVFFDVATNGYSSDERVIFRGVCKEPGGKLPAHDGKVLTVGYVSRLMMGDVTLPVIRVQKSCPWVFPRTLTERQAGADDSKSEFYRCGYSPDATGSNARGNYESGVTPYAACSYTKADCVARGMYTTDSLSRVTGRFGGIQWAPPEAALVRNYVTRKWESVQNAGNEARYGDRVPMLWGTARIEPLVLNPTTDGNYTRFECLLFFGVVDYVYEVVVNGYLIPHTFDDTMFTAVPPGVTGQTEALKGGWWKATNLGDRDGSPTNDAGFNDAAGVPQGDPYGSYAVLEVVVPRKVADAGSTPRVQILARKGSANPGVQIQEILEDWTAWDSATINTTAFNSASGLTTQFIDYTNQFGGSSSRLRFTSALYLRQPESAADVIRGLRNAGRFSLAVDGDGKLALGMKGTLADQQPSAVSGSNYVTAVSSKRATATGVPDGTVANGYVAYKFDETNVLGAVKPSIRAAGNRYSIQFQNEENRYAFDAFSPVDVEDVQRMDQEIPAQFAIRGVTSYDQLARLVSTYSAEALRGNSRGDTGGSLVFEFEASFRCLHLKVGDICMLSWELLGLTDQLVRVERIQPETNFEKARLICSWHSDDWYLDSWGQATEGRHSQNSRNRLARPSFAWMPAEVWPEAGDALYPYTAKGFAISQRYDAGAGTPVARIRVAGNRVVNVTAAKPLPPSVPLQGITANTGGAIAGDQTVYFALAAKNSDGLQSGLSRIVPVYVPAGTSSNMAGLDDIEWDAGSVGFILYGGTNPNRLSLQYEAASANPSTISISEIADSIEGPPDSEFDRFRLKVKLVYHSGVWGAQVSAVHADWIEISGAAFTTNQWAGYELSWLGKFDSSDPVPIANFAIASNTSVRLTLTGTAPDPVAAGLAVGDVVVMRSKPTFGIDGTGPYLDDPNWVNCFAPAGLNPDEEIGRIVRVIHGTGQGTQAQIFDNTATRIYLYPQMDLDGTTRYIIEEGGWQKTVESDRLSTSERATAFAMDVDVPNVLGQVYLVQAFTLDGGDNESLDSTSPAREIYLFGEAPAGGFSSAVQLTVDGTLGIGSDLCPRTVLAADTLARGVKAVVKTAPTGADLDIRILIGATTWVDMTITDGSTEVELDAAAIAALAAIPADMNIRLDVLGVGTTFPAADLSVFVYI